MPKLFRMPLVTLGTHEAPQMKVRVSAERAKHWIDSHKAMTAEGNRIPMPWGHQLDAIPYEDKAARRYAAARWNAGEVPDLVYNQETNWIDAIATVPPGYEVETENGKPTGRLVNPIDHTVIREMSAAIGNWKDGKGKIWRDVIMHAALVTKPVVPNQQGVTAALSTDSSLFTATMSTDGYEYLYTLGPMDREDDPKPPKGEPKGEKNELADLEVTGDLPQIEPVPTAMPATPPPNPIPDVGPDAQCVSDILSYASAIGLPLKADTTAQNILDRICQAFSTVAALGFKLQAPGAAGGQPQPESQINTSTDGAKPEVMGPTTTYMSTETGRLVTLSTDAGEVVEAWAQQTREAYAREWDRTPVPAETIKRQKEHLATATAAVDPVTKRVSLPEARERLALAREAANGRTSVQQQITAPATVQTTQSLTPPPKPGAPPRGGAEPAPTGIAAMATLATAGFPQSPLELATAEKHEASAPATNGEMPKDWIRELARAADLDMKNGTV